MGGKSGAFGLRAFVMIEKNDTTIDSAPWEGGDCSGRRRRSEESSSLLFSSRSVRLAPDAQPAQIATTGSSQLWM